MFGNSDKCFSTVSIFFVHSIDALISVYDGVQKSWHLQQTFMVFVFRFQFSVFLVLCILFLHVYSILKPILSYSLCIGTKFIWEFIDNKLCRFKSIRAKFSNNSVARVFA